MIDVKIDKKDLDKVIDLLKKESHVVSLGFTIDGPRLKVSFTDSYGQLVVVTLFDQSTQTMPTITRTDRL